jgi:hypothetical protein
VIGMLVTAAYSSGAFTRLASAIIRPLHARLGRAAMRNA